MGKGRSAYAFGQVFAAYDSAAWRCYSCRLGGDGRVETHGFFQHGEEVFQRADGEEGDVFGGFEGAADLGGEFGFCGGIGEEEVGSPCSAT